jgi:hypothetical protein
MTAGLPGAGIGGMFYLLMALLAPVRETVRRRRETGSPRQWRLVFRHFLLAASILAGMWLAAWAIGGVIAGPSAIGPHGAVQDLEAYPRFVVRSMALFTLSTLATVLAAVEMLRICRHLQDRRRRRILHAGRGQALPAAPGCTNRTTGRAA